jgi:serine/threonine-protein kinase HipA
MAGIDSLAVWAGGVPAGRLVRERRYEHVFAYGLDASDSVQVSLTMPVRLASWQSRDLHPIFQMNLPEGALLDAIRKAIAKIVGDDDLAILRATGGNQVGRNRFSLSGEEAPQPGGTPESLDDLLTYPDTRELFRELIERHALRSGISGIQPKVMLDAAGRGTLASHGYIVKSWGEDYPQLAANEFFCMTAVKLSGLPTPEFFLSENGGLFVMKRFDIGRDGVNLGFEDMCGLQALGTSQKYTGSYERVARSIRDFISGENLMAAREQFFAALVLSVMLRNGDAHLKNFGVLYPSPAGPVSLAPVYDVITTTAYLRNDVPALTLEGTKKWWSRRSLEKFALSHLLLPAGTIRDIFSRTAGAVADARPLITGYMADHPEFRVVGESMLAAWDQGVADLSC